MTSKEMAYHLVHKHKVILEIPDETQSTEMAKRFAKTSAQDIIKERKDEPGFDDRIRNATSKYHQTSINHLSYWIDVINQIDQI